MDFAFYASAVFLADRQAGLRGIKPEKNKIYWGKQFFGPKDGKRLGSP